MKIQKITTCLLLTILLTGISNVNAQTQTPNYLAKFYSGSTCTNSLLYENSSGLLYIKASTLTTVPSLTSKVTIDGSNISSYPALKIISGNSIGIDVNSGINLTNLYASAGVTGFYMIASGTSSLGYSFSSPGPINIGTATTSPSHFGSEVITPILTSPTTNVETTLNIGSLESSGTIASLSTSKLHLTGRKQVGPSSYIFTSIADFGWDGIETNVLLNINNQLKLPLNAGTGKILASDNEGYASWTDISQLVSGDNLGNHIATKALDMNHFPINNVGAIYGSPITENWNKLELFGSTNSNAGKIEIGDGTTNWNCVKIIGPGAGGSIQFFANAGISMEVRNNEVLFGGSKTVDLKVNGKVLSNEVKVSLDSWSDYVFNSDYMLLPLNELSNYIMTH